MRLPVTIFLLLVAFARPGAEAAGQIIRGRVLDDGDDRPVATAMVRLVDEAGEPRAVTIADSVGRYSLTVPAVGVYRLEAERIGYEPFETPLLDAGSEDRTYALDLLMRRLPVPIPGLEITSERVDQQLRLMIGLSPRSLRWEPIGVRAIQSHVDRSHDLTDLIRWESLPGLEVFETIEGPCYSARRYGCMPVYLNGLSLTAAAIASVPLDMLYSVVVVAPSDGSLAYPRGAVLLYTEAWLR